MENPVIARPYRSHKFPACQRCRQRKIRCRFDQPGQKCMLCRDKGWECVSAPGPYGETRARSDTSGARSAKKIKRAHNSGSGGQTEGSSRSTDGDISGRQIPISPTDADVEPAVNFDAGTRASIISPTDSSIIVGPVVAEDIQILEQYLTSNDHSQTDPVGRSHSTRIASGNPILYLSVPRRRAGLRLSKNPGAAQMDIMEQILGPFRDELIEMYFKHIHPCLPILDRTTVCGRDGECLPPALMCVILALSLPLWNRSSKLSAHPRPDLNYAWSLSVNALQEDFLAPSISTVQSATLDSIGRPTIAMVGNIINEGRTVALAHAFGLNRNPEPWKCSEREKTLRVRAWWGVLVNNRWSSYAHGIPTTVMRNTYDVPLPKLKDLLAPEDNAIAQIHATETFIHLCKLTEILGDILPIAYNLRIGEKDFQREHRRFECDLDDWEANLPAYLLPDMQSSHVSGVSNLYLCYLFVKLLLSRVALRALSDEQEPNKVEARQYRLAMLRASSQEVANYTSSLSSSHLAEFWLPCIAPLLASAAMILLRCTIETTTATAFDSCMDSLASLRHRLRTARDVDEWDLADIFLSQCDEPISRLLNEKKTVSADEAIPEHATTGQNMAETIGAEFEMYAGLFRASDSDLGLPFSVESLGYPSETLWNMFDLPDMLQP